MGRNARYIIPEHFDKASSLQKQLHASWCDKTMTAEDAVCLREILNADRAEVYRAGKNLTAYTGDMGDEPGEDDHLHFLDAEVFALHNQIAFLLENIIRQTHGLPQMRDDGYPDGFVGPPEDIKF